MEPEKNQTPGRNWDVVLLATDEKKNPSLAYTEVTLTTPRGNVVCRLYPVLDSVRGAIWVGGIGGGWDSPAQQLYPRLCRELLAEQITSLRVKYRFPHDLYEATYDVEAALLYLHGLGIRKIALVGHSLGGSVVIRAALKDQAVMTVITLATQGFGAEAIHDLGPRCAILLLHGDKDTVLPPRVSEHLFARAQEPKKLIIYPGNAHVLDESAAEIAAVTKEWIAERL